MNDQDYSGDPADILLVEDNPGDVRLTEEAFKEGQICNTLHVTTDGVEALDFLHQRDGYANARFETDLPGYLCHLFQQINRHAVRRIEVNLQTMQGNEGIVCEASDLCATGTTSR